MTEPVQHDELSTANETDNADEDEHSKQTPPYITTSLRRRMLSEIIHYMPEQVKQRVRALKRLQLDTTHLEAQFYNEVHALESKYHQLYLPFFEKRHEIITGTYEPTGQETEWHLDETSDMFNKVKDLYAEEKPVNPPQSPDVLGVPEFWLTIFRNVSVLAECVQEHDEPVLKHLEDIKVVYVDDPMGFNLEFYFSSNEYFTNTVLTKGYSLKCSPDHDDPFSFEGPEIYKCVGCTIDWKKGKNLTIRLIKKKQRHKSRGSIRTITKPVPNDSFFNFFTPPILPDENSEVDEETQQLLSNDYEIGHYLRERIIPRAVLYYTGEGLEQEEEEEEEDDQDDEDNFEV